MRLRIWTRVRILKLILACTDTLSLAKYCCPTRVGHDTGNTRRTPVSERCLSFFRFSDTVRKKKMRKMGLWLTDLVRDLCSKSSFFFPSKPFSNLDPIPLHRSCRYSFFILLLLLFSCVFGFFIANALQLCVFQMFLSNYSMMSDC